MIYYSKVDFSYYVQTCWNFYVNSVSSWNECNVSLISHINLYTICLFCFSELWFRLNEFIFLLYKDTIEVFNQMICYGINKCVFYQIYVCCHNVQGVFLLSPAITVKYQELQIQTSFVLGLSKKNRTCFTFAPELELKAYG